MKKTMNEMQTKIKPYLQKIKTRTINQNGIHEELSREFATLGDRKKAMIDFYRSTKK